MAVQVVVTFRDRQVGQFAIPGQRVRIGRHPDNDVAIDSTAISRHHCVLDRRPDGSWFVEDLGSNNGTFVNGARVQRAEVREGDVLGVGKFSVSFKADLVAAAPAGPRKTTVIAGPGLAELAAPLRGFLVFLNRAGAPFIVERDATVFGSAPGCDVPVDGPARRAVLLRGYGGFQLLDVGPLGDPPLLGGQPVADRASLAEGSVVTVGPLRFELHVGNPAGDESTMTVNVGAIRPS